METASEKESLLQKGADSWDGGLENVSRKQPSTQVTVKGEKTKQKRSRKEVAKEWSIKILVIFLMCMLSFGSYYVYDNPAALTSTFIDVLGIDTSQYSLFYAVYSWPNVILSIFGGYLLDHVFGLRVGTLVFSALVCVGHLLFAVGAFAHSFWTMVAGRFVFGLGGENLAVAQNNYAVLWFKGKELNMVFGLLLSVSRIGSTVNMNVNQKLYDNGFNFIGSKFARLGSVLLVGFLFCALSWGCGAVLGVVDKLKRKEKDEDDEDKIKKMLEMEQMSRFQRFLKNLKQFFSDIIHFPFRLWLVFIICVFYYVTVFPFIALATVFLMDKYGVSPAQANLLNSLVYWISAVASPFLGILVDRTGLNLFWLNLGTVFTLVAHAMFAFLPESYFIPFLAMVVMGISYSFLACALWPLVALIVPEDQLGTAYGVMQAIQNLGLAVIVYVAGTIVDKAGYLILEVFFMACLCVALIAGILLYISDSGAGGRLNMFAWDRRKLEKEEKEAAKAQEKAKGQLPSQIPSDLFESGPAKPYASPVAPSSAFHIRNRLLSKMGAKLPDHVVSVNPLTTTYTHVGFFR